MACIRGICPFCPAWKGLQPMEAHHYIPKSKGGKKKMNVCRFHGDWFHDHYSEDELARLFKGCETTHEAVIIGNCLIHRRTPPLAKNIRKLYKGATLI